MGIVGDYKPVSSTLGRFAWPAAFVAIAAMGFTVIRERHEPADAVPVVDHAGATVVREIRALSRLETTTLRMEKVISLRDHQDHLHGLVAGDDTLLFVAAGEVILGVDLAKLGEDDVRYDAATGLSSIELPAPEPLETHFDEARSYVHTRHTDVLAKRNEGLEADARRSARAAFLAAAREPAALEGAKVEAERQLRRLAKAWGAKDLAISWKAPTGEVAVQ